MSTRPLLKLNENDITIAKKHWKYGIFLSVVPAHAGVIPGRRRHRRQRRSSPRTRGGDPVNSLIEIRRTICY